MQVPSRFTLALHIFACFYSLPAETKLTSERLAASANVNPVIIRKLLGMLKAAGLVTVARGSGGAAAAKALSKISLLDIYRAVECDQPEGMFRFAPRPNPGCPVCRNLRGVLEPRLERVQQAMERELAAVSIEDICREVDQRVVEQRMAETLAGEQGDALKCNCDE